MHDNIHSIRHHFGVLNDNKIDKLRSLGLLSDPKKNLSTDLKLAAVKAYLLEVLVDLKESFSPNTKLFQAYLFGLSSKALSLLSHLLQKLTSLETFILQLKIYSPDDFPKEGIATIGRSLRKFRKLKTLDLNFDGKYNVPEGALESFGLDLGHLQGLRQLTLSFYKFQFELQGIQSVFRVLGNLSRLQILSINLADTECQGDKGITELANTFGKNKDLHSLCLNLGESKQVGEKSLLYLTEKLAYLTQLSSLDLILNGCDITPDIVVYLSKSLGSLKKLQLLKINLLGNELISHEAYNVLWEGIEILEGLRVLEIRAGTMKNRLALTNEGLNRLGMTIVKLTKLSKLNVTLRASLEINDEGALAFGDLVAKAKDLKDTEIHFMQCSNINKETLDSIKDKLKDLPRMEKLTVRF